MRITLVIYGSLDTVSGGYLYDRQLVGHLRARGDDVALLARVWRNYAAHLRDNLRPAWRRALHVAAGDVLVQDELCHPSLAWANARRPAGAPAIVSIVHHLRSSERHPPVLRALYRAVERRYLASVDGFIFNSATTRAAVTALLPAAAHKPHVIALPAGDRFAPALDAAALDATAIAARAATGPLRVLFVGNLIARKGAHTLLDALAACRDVPIVARIVGSAAAEPRYAARLHAQAAALPAVQFSGALDDDALAAELAAAHLLVVPSNYEGFGIVYLEAQGFGLPAIGTTAGAAGELISDGVNGYLIAPDDAPALTRHLRRLAADRARLAQLGTAALARYRAHPGWETSMAQARHFLQEMAHGMA